MNMTIESIFSLTSSGAVLAGYLEAGNLKVGQDILVKTKNNSIKTKIEGIEINKESVSAAKAGQHLAIMASNIDFDLLSDGVLHTEDGLYIPENLKVIEAPKKWWNIFS